MKNRMRLYSNLGALNRTKEAVVSENENTKSHAENLAAGTALEVIK
mgnify:CR=1 FL=1